MLFLPDSILSVSPIKVRNSSDLYSRIDRSGEAYGLGRVYFDCEQFVSILCAHDIEEGINFVVTEQKNSAGIGKRYGYDIFLKEIVVTLHARWHNRIMMGSFKPLLDFIRWGSVSIERPHDEMFFVVVHKIKLRCESFHEFKNYGKNGKSSEQGTKDPISTGLYV